MPQGQRPYLLQLLEHRKAVHQPLDRHNIGRYYPLLLTVFRILWRQSQLLVQEHLQLGRTRDFPDDLTTLIDADDRHLRRVVDLLAERFGFFSDAGELDRASFDIASNAMQREFHQTLIHRRLESFVVLIATSFT